MQIKVRERTRMIEVPIGSGSYHVWKLGDPIHSTPTIVGAHMFDLLDHFWLNVVEANVALKKLSTLRRLQLLQNWKNQVALPRKKVYPPILIQVGQKFWENISLKNTGGCEMFPISSPSPSYERAIHKNQCTSRYKGQN